MTTAHLVPHLRSANISRNLLWWLWIRLTLAVLSVVFSLVEVFLPPLYEFFSFLDGFQALLGFIASPVTLVLSLIWLYKLHQDLRVVYPGYPIRPGGALARFMIPFYNVWGIWNTLNTIARYFKASQFTARYGYYLRSLLPWFYGVGVISRILGRIIFRRVFESPETIPPSLILVAAIVDLALIWIMLQIAQSIVSAIRYQRS